MNEESKKLTVSPFFDRDLSWLSFNYRVLQEAKDKNLPLYERIKFLAIYSSNLDEFFGVRVAGIQSLLGVKKKQRAELDFDPRKLLFQIQKEATRQQREFDKIFRKQILPELKSHKIYLLSAYPKLPEHRAFLAQYFEDEVFPYIHVELLRRKRIRHFLRENALYHVVKLYSTSPRAFEDARKAGTPEKRSRRAIIQIPTHYLGRFVELPHVGDKYYVMFLDDIIRYNLDKIFPGYEIKACYSFKLNRNADLQIDDEYSGDLVEKIQTSLKKRQTGVPARFLYDRSMPKNLLRYLRDTFGIDKEELMPGGKYHNFRDFFGFPNPLSPKLEREPTPPLPHPDLEDYASMFRATKDQDWLLHFPYQSYDYVIRFFNQAAIDPLVVSIQTTQYRVASNSAIVNALIRAAQNGKKVTVFVEIKARFDEINNLRSARAMEKAGVKIIYSFPGLKVHAKVALVHRKEGRWEKGYAFLGTGNFNENTAKIYADHGYFTSERKLIKELEEVFKHLQDRNYLPPPFKNLLVAQFGMRQKLLQFIDREIRHVKAGKKGYMLIKLNNLEDDVMIRKMYEASQAGVEIELIVRGICCLRPGLPGLSENIRATRIVDQFLEHARVFVFHNNGKEEIYMGSADWMKRNLSRRIELVFPIKKPDLKAEVMAILKLQLADNVKAVRLNENIENIPLKTKKSAKKLRMQLEVYRRFKEEILVEEE